MVEQTLTPRAPSPGADAPPAVLRFLFKQFGRPTGWLGRVAGLFMARNTYDDAWVVALLDVEANDRVLEIGFGPGVAIELLADRARTGHVAGIDPSEVMLSHAVRRNADAVRAGRVDLRLGSIERLPFADASFDKACALHSLYFWPSLEGGLDELKRILKPRGRLALAVRKRIPRGGPLNPSRYGLTDEQIAHVAETLGTHGFRDISTETRDFPREIVAVLVATRAW
jgi:ubiquinone/menaquinone biosynthesis C-methylase UbiE